MCLVVVSPLQWRRHVCTTNTLLAVDKKKTDFFFLLEMRSALIHSCSVGETKTTQHVKLSVFRKVKCLRPIICAPDDDDTESRHPISEFEIGDLWQQKFLELKIALVKIQLKVFNRFHLIDERQLDSDKKLSSSRHSDAMRWSDGTTETQTTNYFPKSFSIFDSMIGTLCSAQRI